MTASTILVGDCRARMAELAPCSVDSVVCDPPYELGFMGKGWDKTGIACDVTVWAEVLRVLKPGGHLIAFSGTRTYHRMACAIEDAGFEIRDQLAWVYGSGFPKSLDISKQIDKGAGEQRGRNRDLRNGPNTKQETKGQPRIVGGYASDAALDNGPVTEAAREWQGWGTVLDPFMGSGSTIIAATAGQFNAIGCELSDAYVDIAVQRIRAEAGLFAEVEVKR